MRNIRLNTNDDKSGKVIYNSGIVHNIVVLAIGEVEGATPLPGKKNGISLFIEKDGIYADVSVVVKYGYNVPELAYRIQQSVKQSVENMTHFRVFEVNVHVADVIFCEPAPIEKEEEHVEEDGAQASHSELE